MRRKRPPSLPPSLDQITVDTRSSRASRRQPVHIDGTHLTDLAGGEYRIDVVSKLSYDLEEYPYMITGIAMYKVMYQKRIRGEARNVMDWLAAHVETANIVREFCLREIADDTGVHYNNVSYSLGKLERLDLIQRGKRGGVHVNPRHMFIGSSSAQRMACREWDRAKEEKASARREKMSVVSA